MGREPSRSPRRHDNGNRHDQPDITGGPASVFGWIMVDERVDVRCRLHRGRCPLRLFRGRAGRRRIRRCRGGSVRLAWHAASAGRPIRPGRLDPGPPCVLSTPAPTFRVWRCRTCMPRTDSVVVACLSDLPPDPNRSRMATRGSRPAACRADRQRTGRACRSARGNAESRNGGGIRHVTANRSRYVRGRLSVSGALSAFAGCVRAAPRPACHPRGIARTWLSVTVELLGGCHRRRGRSSRRTGLVHLSSTGTGSEGGGEGAGTEREGDRGGVESDLWPGRGQGQ